MQRLRTVLLRHARRGDTHFDWMFETPGPRAAAEPMTTFRVGVPWDAWAQLPSVPLTPRPPHRRAYLTRQGPVSGGRGFVTRVAAGTLDVLDQSAAGGTLLLHAPGTPPLEVRWRRLTDEAWELHARAFGPAAAKR
ncbi:MAG: hypothetical protein AAGE65_01065 [Planctomycetota bacterium]